MDLRKNIWVEKYQPTNFNDIILNSDAKSKLGKAMNEIPNVLLYGSPGVGKGCFANLLINKDNVDYMWVNASDESGIDVFRNKITPFATAMCMKDMKIVILNEADSLTSGPQGAQKLLRQLMEDTYKICRFILICNYHNYIIPELKSRFQIQLKLDAPPKKDIGKLCLKILKAEDIKYETKTVLDIIKKSYPDIRRTINVLQENCIDGKLTGSKMSGSEEIFDKILKLVIDKNLEGIREELRSNYIPYPELYEHLYENAGEFKQPGSAIMKIGEHLYRDQSYVIKEINFMHMVVGMFYDKVV